MHGARRRECFGPHIGNFDQPRDQAMVEEGRTVPGLFHEPLQKFQLKVSQLHIDPPLRRRAKLSIPGADNSLINFSCLQDGTKALFQQCLRGTQGVKTMRKAITQTAEPTIITVGELISELCRLPDRAAVTFRCPLHQQELRFYRLLHRSKGVVEIELNQYPESPPVAPSQPAGEPI